MHPFAGDHVPFFVHVMFSATLSLFSEPLSRNPGMQPTCAVDLYSVPFWKLTTALSRSVPFPQSEKVHPHHEKVRPYQTNNVPNYDNVEQAVPVSFTETPLHSGRVVAMVTRDLFVCFLSILVEKHYDHLYLLHITVWIKSLMRKSYRCVYIIFVFNLHIQHFVKKCFIIKMYMYLYVVTPKMYMYLYVCCNAYINSYVKWFKICT